MKYFKFTFFLILYTFLIGFMCIVAYYSFNMLLVVQGLRELINVVQ